MKDGRERNPEPKPADLPQLPLTDESGDVDLSLIDYNLSLTVAERIRQHAEALKLVRRLEEVGRQWYRPVGADPQATH